MVDFKNGTDKKFVDVSSEEWREYDFIEKKIRIENPIALCVTDNGHRVFDAQGTSHYIPMGWIHLYWRARPGEPNFVR